MRLAARVAISSLHNDHLSIDDANWKVAKQRWTFRLKWEIGRILGNKPQILRSPIALATLTLCYENEIHIRKTL